MITTGTDIVEDEKKLYEISKRIMKEGGFTLRKWITNNRELQTFLGNKEDLSTTELNHTEPNDNVNIMSENRLGRSDYWKITAAMERITERFRNIKNF